MTSGSHANPSLFFYPFLIGFTKKRNGWRGAGNPGVSFATIENPIHRNELFGMGIVIRLRHILESSRNFAYMSFSCVRKEPASSSQRHKSVVKERKKRREDERGAI